MEKVVSAVKKDEKVSDITNARKLYCVKTKMGTFVGKAEIVDNELDGLIDCVDVLPVAGQGPSGKPIVLYTLTMLGTIAEMPEELLSFELTSKSPLYKQYYEEVIGIRV